MQWRVRRYLRVFEDSKQNTEGKGVRFSSEKVK